MTKTTRADAVRNREKLLTAATELFAAQGTDVSLDAIAKRAGAGIGTLYRHFPTRHALVEAAPPDEALAEWMDRFVAYAAAKKGMKGALQSVGASELFAETRAQIL